MPWSYKLDGACARRLSTASACPTAFGHQAVEKCASVVGTVDVRCQRQQML